AVVTREALLHHVWGYDPAALTRTVDTHVARLRQKIETTAAEPQHLLTVHRVGYRFVP
ncbi:MAG: DNA-binding response regulator, partial [Acidobacteria bacterium]